MEQPISPEKQKALDAAQKLRDKAGEEASLRGKCFEQSKKEFESGDKAKAKELSDEGKKHGALMEQYNREAADAFFAAHNQGRDDYTIDLHGLHVDEAIERLKARLAKIGKSGDLVIIWGAGNHSEGGVRKIKPAVVELLTKEKMNFKDDTPNHGCCTVFFTSAVAQGGKTVSTVPTVPSKTTPTVPTIPTEPATKPSTKTLPVSPATEKSTYCGCCCFM